MTNENLTQYTKTIMLFSAGIIVTGILNALFGAESALMIVGGAVAVSFWKGAH